MEQGDKQIEDNRKKMEEDKSLRESELAQDRFAKAIEQIGSEKSAVRLGAIYSLHQLAKTQGEQYAEPVFNILISYIRDENKSLVGEKNIDEDKPQKPSTESEAIISLLFKRADEYKSYEERLPKDYEINLSNTAFLISDWSKCVFYRAVNFYKSEFKEEVSFSYTRFESNANFSNSRFKRKVDFRGISELNNMDSRLIENYSKQKIGESGAIIPEITEFKKYSGIDFYRAIFELSAVFHYISYHVVDSNKVVIQQGNMFRDINKHIKYNNIYIKQLVIEYEFRQERESQTTPLFLKELNTNFDRHFEEDEEDREYFINRRTQNDIAGNWD